MKTYMKHANDIRNYNNTYLRANWYDLVNQCNNNQSFGNSKENGTKVDYQKQQPQWH
jgi:hypothetical protein